MSCHLHDFRFPMIGIPNVEVISLVLSLCGVLTTATEMGRRKMMIYASIGQALGYLIITVLIRYNGLPGYSGSKQVAPASVGFFFM